MSPADIVLPAKRPRLSAAALAVALLALWAQILQPLAHPQLLRALMDSAPDDYTIICTSNGPQLVARAATPDGAGHHDSNPLASTQRPMGDCCMGVPTAAPLPGPVLLALVLVQVSKPAPLVLPTADIAPPSLAWRPSQPRGPPLFA